MRDTIRRGATVTIDNDIGMQLRLTKWEDDHLTIEIAGQSDYDSNFIHFAAEFGILGHLDELQELFQKETYA